MTASELRTAMIETLDELYEHNQMIFDYWISEMYDENDEEIPSFFTEENFKQMREDLHVIQSNLVIADY